VLTSSLDDELVIRHLSKVCLALPALSLPRLALCHAPQEHIFDAAPTQQRIVGVEQRVSVSVRCQTAT
jgi:hypothetical protein